MKRYTTLPKSAVFTFPRSLLPSDPLSPASCKVKYEIKNGSIGWSQVPFPPFLSLPDFFIGFSGDDSCCDEILKC